MKPTSFFLVLASFIMIMPNSALAHSVWIEPTKEGSLAVYFGEWGHEVEKSPGHLDSLTTVTAWSAEGSEKPQQFVVAKKDDCFDLGGVKPAQAVQAETGFGVMKSGDKPARRPIFYARWQPAGAWEAQPALTLDLVPAGKPGEVRVLFRGKPLPEVKLTHWSPKASTDMVSDKDGLVKLPEAVPGLHMLTLARFSEEAPGFFQGSAYEIASHSVSLTWVVGE
ncbi:MAG: hypothetical protein R3F13_19810 [Prosthecobacter sp.]